MNIARKPIRDGFGEGLLNAGARNDKLIVLGCDISDSIRVGWFAERYPERFFSFGIAEQNAAGVCAGLALCGFVPVFGTYGVFAAGRAFDQIRTSIAYPNLKVIICGAHGGISVGPDGATHQALEDIATMRALPNMTVVVPSDANMARKATYLVVEATEGPVYLRTGREPVPLFTKEDEPFEIGKAIPRREGKDIAIIACGAVVFEALVAAEELYKIGISARVLDLPTIKPLDIEAIISSAKRCGAVVTVEEHNIVGGMGSAVAEILAAECPVPMRFLGINDRFGESGSPEELMTAFSLDGNGIASSVEAFIKER